MLLGKWDLLFPSSGVRIDKISSDTRTKGCLLFHLLNSCGDTLAVVITTICQFCVSTGYAKFEQMVKFTS